MQRNHKFLSFFLLLILIAAALETTLFLEVSKFTHPPRSDSGIDPKTLLLSSNDVVFDSNGARLHGWHIIGKPNYPVLIVAHNYGSNRTEILAKLEGLVTTLNKRGYSIFLFDFRGHGDSNGNSALGYREKDDVLAALKTVLKYRTIAPRVAVFGIGMGAIAATEAASAADEVKFLILDSIYQDIPTRCTDGILTDWTMMKFARPFLIQMVEWNLKHGMKIPDTKLNLVKQMPQLYPKAVLFVEKNPLSPDSKALYDATKEPKELIQLGETAEGDLIGDARATYNKNVEMKIEKYFPPMNGEQTIELPK
ncbi:MAG: hypothetical protein C5B54_04975 [Acidobacteria bacterium]|nr:MAG: hypothetical protein C5B54_04975 [Acidobacteriota bacterium]